MVPLVCALALPASVAAQDPPATPAAADSVTQSLKKGAVELGALVGGGTGLGHSDGTQFVYAGGRAGFILTGNHLPGWLRGNFEWAVDAMPVYTVLAPTGAIYGGSFKPAIWQWNFTRGKKIAPYVAAAGGIVFSTSNVPPGDTSTVNFTSQFVSGAHIFVKPRRAFFIESAIGHLSSASLGPHNPGYNISLLFTVGYSWFKHVH
ncbi:MAG TPA: acyloxyacyl hydrolase [Candidatus Acidoferrales bacterium]|nr:acyloxyacyl hydrolase [Candidatus Acidoferrales bacterium]